MNIPSSPWVCFSVRAALVPKERLSPGQLQLHLPGDSVSCSGCGFVDEGWVPHLRGKAVWEPAGYTCTAPALQGRPVHWQPDTSLWQILASGQPGPSLGGKKKQASKDFMMTCFFSYPQCKEHVCSLMVVPKGATSPRQAVLFLESSTSEMKSRQGKNKDRLRCISKESLKDQCCILLFLLCGWYQVVVFVSHFHITRRLQNILVASNDKLPKHFFPC